MYCILLTSAIIFFVFPHWINVQHKANKQSIPAPKVVTCVSTLARTLLWIRFLISVRFFLVKNTVKIHLFTMFCLFTIFEMKIERWIEKIKLMNLSVKKSNIKVMFSSNRVVQLTGKWCQLIVLRSLGFWWQLEKSLCKLLKKIFTTIKCCYKPKSFHRCNGSALVSTHRNKDESLWGSAW